MEYLTLPHYFLPRLYSVLRANDTSALPSGTPSSQGSGSKSKIVPLAVGLTFGLLTLAIIVLAAFYLQRRRRRKSALLDARAAPPHYTHPAQGDQLSGALQESKGHHQPSTHGSTLSSGLATATAVTTTIPESGKLPSHELWESGPMEKLSPSNV